VLTSLAIGASIGLVVALSRRGNGRNEQALPSPDDVSLASGAELAAADGGYDATIGIPIDSAVATPYTVDLR
jgi:hypothetical protein